MHTCFFCLWDELAAIKLLLNLLKERKLKIKKSAFLQSSFALEIDHEKTLEKRFLVFSFLFFSCRIFFASSLSVFLPGGSYLSCNFSSPWYRYNLKKKGTRTWASEAEEEEEAEENSRDNLSWISGYGKSRLWKKMSTFGEERRRMSLCVLQGIWTEDVFFARVLQARRKSQSICSRFQTISMAYKTTATAILCSSSSCRRGLLQPRSASKAWRE